MDSLDSTSRLYETRTRAVAEMKRKPNPNFLGRWTETGQAFDRAMKARQCCYICQGTMAYTIPAQFSEKDVKNNLCQLKWNLRCGYTHSCIELEVSL